MKPRNERETVRTGDIQPLRRTDMTISARGMGSIMHTLINAYPKPLKAAVRETISNAIDTHRASGNPDAIDVWMPTSNDPMLVVVDQGEGMDDEVLTSNFGAYGESTKTGSDDYTGMLGIGAKAPLAYTTEFFVETVRDGWWISARVTLNTPDDGGLPVGVLEVLAEGERREPNGTTVMIPIEPAHLYDAKRVVEYVTRHLPPGSVRVDGEPVKSYFDPATGADGALLVEDVAIVHDNQKEVRLAHGSDVYVVDDWHFIGEGRWSVVARVPVGTVTPAPSREDIIEDDASADLVKTLKDLVEERVEGALQQWIEEADNLTEAAVRAKVVKDNGSQNRPVAFRWRGREYATAVRVDGWLFRADELDVKSRYRPNSLDLTEDDQNWLVVRSAKIQSLSKHVPTRLKRWMREADQTFTHVAVIRQDVVPVDLREHMGASITYEALKEVPLPEWAKPKPRRRERKIDVYDSGYGRMRRIREDEITADVLVLLDAAQRDRGARSMAEGVPSNWVVGYMPGSSHDRFAREYPHITVLNVTEALQRLAKDVPVTMIGESARRGIAGVLRAGVHLKGAARLRGLLQCDAPEGAAPLVSKVDDVMTCFTRGRGGYHGGVQALWEERKKDLRHEVKREIERLIAGDPLLAWVDALDATTAMSVARGDSEAVNALLSALDA